MCVHADLRCLTAFKPHWQRYHCLRVPSYPFSAKWEAAVDVRVCGRRDAEAKILTSPLPITLCSFVLIFVPILHAARIALAGKHDFRNWFINAERRLLRHRLQQLSAASRDDVATASVVVRNQKKRLATIT